MPIIPTIKPDNIKVRKNRNKRVSIIELNKLSIGMLRFFLYGTSKIGSKYSVQRKIEGIMTIIISCLMFPS